MFDSEKSKAYRFMIRIFTETVYFFLEKPRGVDFIRTDESPRLMSPSASHYISVPFRTVEKILKDIRIGPDDSFLDIGCGKGFVLYAAHRRGFGRVHGIDISADLCRIAHKNMQTLRISGRATVECIDATRFQNMDGYSFIFMNNPFSGDVMAKVVHNIECSLMRTPRSLTVAYLNPRFHQAFDGCALLKLTQKRSVNVYNPLSKWSVYYYRSNYHSE